MSRHLMAVLVTTLATVGCGGPLRVKGHAMEGPDMGGVLRVSTYFGIAHACPIGEGYQALTSRHVVDREPLNLGAPMFSGRWSDAYGSRGWWDADARGLSYHRDLAIISLRSKSHKAFKVSEKAPFEDQPMYVLGYDYTRANEGFAPFVHRVLFMREVAGLLMLSANTESGSSGSCVLSAQGEVVGILMGWVRINTADVLGTAVAVWGEDFSDGLTEAKK